MHLHASSCIFMQHGFMQYLCQINNAQQGTHFQSFNLEALPPDVSSLQQEANGHNDYPTPHFQQSLGTFNETLPNLNSHWCTLKNMLFRQEDLLLGTPSQIVLGEGVTKVSWSIVMFFQLLFFWRGIVTLAADAATSWSSVHLGRCCFNTYMPDWWGYRSL